MHQQPPDQQHLTVDETIHDEVWEAQSASIDNDTAGDELGGHHHLNRLKVAAWASMIQHRSHIGEAEWAWAGAVMEHSERIRRRLDASVESLKVKQAREAGTLDAERRGATDEAAARKWEKLLDSLAKWGADPGKGPAHKRETGWFTLSDVMRSAKSGEPRRVHARKLADTLVERGLWSGDGTYYWVRTH